MTKPIVKDLKTILDDRGYLYEILRSDDSFFDKFGQLYVSTINPGTIKGFHVHQNKTDYMACVEGQIKLVAVDGELDVPVFYEYHLSPLAPKLVVIPPGLWHGWMCIGSSSSILVSVTTEPYREDSKDEQRVDPINNPWGYKWEIKHG